MLQINNDGQKYNPGNGCHKNLDPSGLRGISFVGALGNTFKYTTRSTPLSLPVRYGRERKGPGKARK